MAAAAVVVIMMLVIISADIRHCRPNCMDASRIMWTCYERNAARKPKHSSPSTFWHRAQRMPNTCHVYQVNDSSSRFPFRARIPHTRIHNIQTTSDIGVRTSALLSLSVWLISLFAQFTPNA